ncbi:MAG: cyclophilin-like fold protein [Schwartzia sp. (in: firmicutes)]
MKSMMKRAAALLTALTVLAVTGCGASAKKAESPAKPTEKPVKTAKTANAAPRIAPEPIDISLVKLKITVDGKVMTANIEHNRTVLSFLGQLPLSLPMKNLYDREMCYHYGAGGLPAAGTRRDRYEVGDIIYWPPRGSFVILYKQNGEEVECIPIGHIDEGVEIFDGGGDRTVTFEMIPKERHQT